MKRKFKDITKKALAVFCVFAMLMGTGSFAEAQSDAVSEFSDEELYAIELLNVIGVYDGVDSIVGKDAFVRRDVFAFLTARIMGLSDAIYSGESFFDDVDKNNFAYNAVNTLAQMNIIRGGSNGKFEPMRDITLDEATEIILRIMGYSQLMDMQGKGIYQELIRKNDLHNNIEYAKDKRLQVKYLSILLYNALTSDFLQMVSISTKGNVEYRVDKGNDLLVTMFGVYEIEGVISANERTSADVGSSSNPGWVRIGNEEFDAGKTDADKYIGYYVTGHYRKGDVNTLLCFEANSKNTVVVMNSEDAEYADFTYTTYIDNKEKTYTVSRGLNLIYNGKTVYYDKTKMDPEYGTITLINNNKDKDFDTVIINNVKNFVVGSYGSESNVIQSKYDGSVIDLNKYGENMLSIHKVDGKAYKAASIKEWDILSVIESADEEYIDITVSNETVNGTVEMISESDGVPVLTINGEKYKVASDFYTNKNYNLTLGYSGTFHLDMFGRIAAASGGANRLKWGYLIRAVQEKGAFQPVKFRLLTQDSSDVKIIEASDKFFVNGTGYSSTNAATVNIGEYQPVRYTLDTDGKIKRIFTAGNDFIQLAANSSRGFVANVFVQNQVMDIAVDSNTVFLQVPNNAAKDDRNEDEFYSVMTLSNFVRDSWYTVSAYGFEPDDITASLVVVERLTSTAGTPSGTYMVVSEIQKGLDKENCVIDKIIGYDSNKNKVEISTRGEDVAASFGVEEGDFFVMVLYPDGTLQRAVQIYDYKTGAFNKDFNARDYNMTNFGRFAYAYDKNSNFLLLSDDSTSFTTHKVLNTSSATVIIVDGEARGDMVKVGSVSDIKTLKQSGKASRIVFYGSNSVPRVIVSYQ